MQNNLQYKHYESLSDIVALCKSRGFVFQSSEIYGGLASCWDYGPLGSLLKRNVKAEWWKAMTRRLDVVGIDASILMHPTTWKASGHLDGFTDPLVDCKSCKTRFREDHAPKGENGELKCPNCGSTDLTETRNFNLMFKTNMGPVQDEGSEVFLRPETAQGIFVNFENVKQTTRKKLPFGIAQIGKSFRNEITPGNFVFRTREFEQMEMQYFVTPGEDTKWFEYWKRERFNFFIEQVGLTKDKLRWAEHGPDELAHYAKAAFDVEYEFPFGWGELEGVHNRTDFDLKQHQEYSGKKLEYFDEQTKEKYIPYVIETAVGADRLTLAVLCDGMVKEMDAEGKELRNVFKVEPQIAPYKMAILPLSKKEPLLETAHQIFKEISPQMSVDYDEAGSIGKRYRRQDEVGTPFCVTVDFETAEDHKVTVRHRDNMSQQRVSLERLDEFIDEGLKSYDEFGGE
jgi:glycyl-tRNA synthetase